MASCTAPTPVRRAGVRATIAAWSSAVRAAVPAIAPPASAPSARASAACMPSTPAHARGAPTVSGVPTVWTIGYERLLPPELVAELEAAGVRRVLDVRYRPQSRRPGMSKTRLGELLASRGIAYEHRRALGTPPDIRWLFKAG